MLGDHFFDEAGVDEVAVVPDAASLAIVEEQPSVGVTMAHVAAAQPALNAAQGRNVHRSADCEPGEQIISGGGQPSVFGIEMTTTRPSGNGWLYQAKNNTASDQTITAFALCLVQ